MTMAVEANTALAARVQQALDAVCDPEIPVVTLRELGVLRDVVITEAEGRPHVEVVITPTYSGCPAMAQMAEDLRAALERMGITGHQITTVLAPGYNAAHYNHIHVDLMRRASGRRPCRPNAIPGEVVAARARAVYASKHGPTYTGSIGKPTNAGAKKPGAMPEAVPGADGLDDDDAVTGSIGKPPAAPRNNTTPGEDGEFDEDDVTGSIAAPAQSGWPRLAPQGIDPRYRPDNASNY